jgi:hypothetical protein
MNVEYKDFIAVFSDVYPEGFCEHLIAEFDRHKNFGAGTNRQKAEGSPKHDKDDYLMAYNGKNLNLHRWGVSSLARRAGQRNRG